LSVGIPGNINRSIFFRFFFVFLFFLEGMDFAFFFVMRSPFRPLDFDYDASEILCRDQSEQGETAINPAIATVSSSRIISTGSSAVTGFPFFRRIPAIGSGIGGVASLPEVLFHAENIVDMINDISYFLDMKNLEWSEKVLGLKHKGGEPHLIFEIMRTYHALINVLSRKVGMPFARVKLLRMLAAAFPGEMGILEIARRLHINGAAVTRQIKYMEGFGLVARMPDEHDGRRCQVKLTAKGRNLFEQIHQRQHEFERYFTSGESTPEEVQTAARVLFRLRSVLEKMD
jgi:DNA-binding MarR family transcriptional regulator